MQAVATVSQDRIRSELERQGIQSDVAAALAGAAATRGTASYRDWLLPILAAGLLALLGWIALSIHDMNARIGVIETHLTALEERQAALQEEIRTGLADAKADRQVIDGKVNDILRRLPLEG